MTPQTSLTPQEFLSPAFLNLSEQLADEFFTPSAALAEPGITLEQEQPSQPLPAVRATDTTANGLRSAGALNCDKGSISTSVQHSIALCIALPCMC